MQTFTFFVSVLALALTQGDLTFDCTVAVLDESSGQFLSPGYPDLDDDEVFCWKILSPTKHKIQMTFKDFDLLDTSICNDKVEIYDGDDIFGTYYGADLHQRTITSASNSVLVVLESCSSSLLADRRGIHASYETVYPTTPSSGSKENFSKAQSKNLGTAGIVGVSVGVCIMVACIVSLLCLLVSKFIMKRRRGETGETNSAGRDILVEHTYEEIIVDESTPTPTTTHNEEPPYSLGLTDESVYSISSGSFVYI